MFLSVKFVMIGNKVLGKDIHVGQTLDDGVNEAGIAMVLYSTDCREIHP